MNNQKPHRQPDFNESQPADIHPTGQLLPLFLKYKSQRSIHQKNDACPKKNGNEDFHQVYCVVPITYCL